MIILNTTKICDELIKDIALDMGVDMREAGVLEIEYIGEIKGSIQGDNQGEFFGHTFEGVTRYCIRLLPWASTETLAHELRHLAQCQQLEGFDNMVQVNKIETETMGYWDNILEVDAREAAKAWKV